MGYTIPPKPKKRKIAKGLGDYPIEDMPPPPSEDANLFREAWNDTKHVKLKYKK